MRGVGCMSFYPIEWLVLLSTLLYDIYIYIYNKWLSESHQCMVQSIDYLMCMSVCCHSISMHLLDWHKHAPLIFILQFFFLGYILVYIPYLHIFSECMFNILLFEIFCILIIWGKMSSIYILRVTII